MLAKQVAPHLRRQGEKVIPNSLKKENSSGKSTLDGVVKVAASGLQGWFLRVEREFQDDINRELGHRGHRVYNGSIRVPE